MRLAIVELDHGASFGVGLQIGRWRRAARVRNPFFMDLTRIYRLDLR